MEFVAIEERLREPDVLGLLAYAVGYPTEAKLDGSVRAYELVASRFVYGLSERGSVVALIGGELESPTRAAVLHIAVRPLERGRGLGQQLLRQLTEQFALLELHAETGSDSVGFYERCGFRVASLGERYPGVERFECRGQVPFLLEIREGDTSSDGVVAGAT